MPVVTLPTWAQRPNTTGRHPWHSARSPPARRKPCTGHTGRRGATLCSGNVDLLSCHLASALCSGFPRDLAALSPGTSPHSPKKTSLGPNQKHSLLQLPFHPTMARASGELGRSDTMRGGFSTSCFLGIGKEMGCVGGTSIHET